VWQRFCALEKRGLQSVPVLATKALRKAAFAIVVAWFTNALAEDGPRDWQTYAYHSRAGFGLRADLAEVARLEYEYTEEQAKNLPPGTCSCTICHFEIRLARVMECQNEFQDASARAGVVGRLTNATKGLRRA